MQVVLSISTSLLNLTYTLGYTPPPSYMADPQKFIPLLGPQTWPFNSLTASLGYPVLNNDTLSGEPQSLQAASVARVCAPITSHVQW
jgi:hypothetical protein